MQQTSDAAHRQGSSADDIGARVRALQAALDSQVERVRTDGDLHELERRGRIRNLWSRALSVQGDIVADYERGLEEKAAERERRLFAVPSGMRGEVRECFDSLSARVEPLLQSADANDVQRGRQQLRTIWERSLWTSDTPMMHACGWLALEKGDVEMRTTYLSARPEKKFAFDSYCEAQQAVDSFRSAEGKLGLALVENVSLRPPAEAME